MAGRTPPERGLQELLELTRKMRRANLKLQVLVRWAGLNAPGDAARGACEAATAASPG